MLKHLDELQSFLELLCPKTRVLEENIKKNKTNLQSRKGKGHVNIGASSQDCKVQGSNLDQTKKSISCRNRKLLCRSTLLGEVQ